MITLPASFPVDGYTPFGYLDNPAHSAVSNRSGVVRSVPPLGFGFWARTLPWAYGDGLERHLSYLSFLRLSVCIDNASFNTSADFTKNQVELVSRYHTKTLLSYDWQFGEVVFSARYFLANENALVCVLEAHSTSSQAKPVTVHATNVYGSPGHRYWGRDGALSQPDRLSDAAISKIWAYGDVFVLTAGQPNQAYKATGFGREWQQWVENNDLSSNPGAVIYFSRGQDHLYTTLSYTLNIPASGTTSLVVCLARGVNTASAKQAAAQAIKSAASTAARQLAEDESFYSNAPLLSGDWPAAWKHGWIYDLETLRMTIRPPVGIYKHHWDGMQVHTPRSVLGEMSLDAFVLSYADCALAKEVIYGTFADAPAANVPCTREDGSMNMISESGAECGTAPNWGLPFLTIQSIYLRDHDDAWIRQLYPLLKAYLEWWLANRTDADGWFHADCSWESGQDGSKRFLSDTEGGTATFVRTVDIEAAVTHAMHTMAFYAQIAGSPEDQERWRLMAQEHTRRVQAMFYDGWFRDVDSRTGQPIFLTDYYDIMMLYPLALQQATPQQVAAVRPQLAYFQAHPQYWLEWPAFVQSLVEAAWTAGERLLAAQVLVDIGNRIYARTDARAVPEPLEFNAASLADQYGFRIPGVAGEYWPLSLEGDIYPGGECYGWGATLPLFVIRSIIGFREAAHPDEECFHLAPALPAALFEPGKSYGVTNLQYRGSTNDVLYTLQADGKMLVRLTCRLASPRIVNLVDEAGLLLAQAKDPAKDVHLTFSMMPGQVVSVRFTPLMV